LIRDVVYFVEKGRNIQRDFDSRRYQYWLVRVEIQESRNKRVNIYPYASDLDSV
jgi:hypothetical protein